MAAPDMTALKLPPQNLEAEQSVLGAVLIDNDALNKILEILTPDQFYKDSHRRIFSAILDLSERNESIDLITLTDHLKAKGELELVGGAAYLSALVNSVPTAANVRQHSKIIAEKALLRSLINVATEIIAQGYEDSGRVEDLLDRAESTIFGISERKIRQSFTSIKDMIKDSFATIEKLAERKERVTGVATGFTDMDEKLAGLQPADLIIIAGRPSMGKTALALGIAQHAAIEKRATCAIFSLEMSKEQLVLRMLCSEARVDAHKVRTGYTGRADWPRLTTAAGRLTDAPIFIDDTPALSVLEMRAKARRLKADRGLDLIIVDYLQLMRGRGDSETREREISEISRSLKALAKELNVPVIALSQLSRAVESRGGEKRPVLADLRESGAIEQDADVVLFIYRQEVYEPDKEEVRGIADVNIAKQRNGPVGNLKMQFNSSYTRFEDLDRMHDFREES
jgi:replicative DNA helicase